MSPRVIVLILLLAALVWFGSGCASTPRESIQLPAAPAVRY